MLSGHERTVTDKGSPIARYGSGLSFLCICAALCCAAPVQAAFPGRNGRIAFTNSIQLGPQSDVFDTFLYSVGPTGHKPRRLDDDGFDAAYSPGGKRIVYGRDELGLVVIRADGRGRVREPRSTWGGSDPDWSPSGRGIVFARGYPGDLFIYRHGQARPLIRNFRAAQPAWSVAGWIAFARLDEQEPPESEIYIVRPNGSGLRKVVDDGDEPDWSPDGKRIVFIDADGMVATVRPDGTGRRTLRPGGSPAFSPDGHRIVYLSPERRPRLMVMGSGGKRPHSILATPPGGRGTISGPDWQPLPAPG